MYFSPRARTSSPLPLPLCFFVRASASTQAAKLFALWPLPLFRPLGPSIFDFRTIPPSPFALTAFSHCTIHSARPFMYLGSSGRHLRQPSLKAGTPQPNGLSKGHKRPPSLPPSRWHRSSPPARARSLARPLIHCLRDRRMPWNNAIRERLTGRRRRRAEPGERERGRETLLPAQLDEGG